MKGQRKGYLVPLLLWCMLGCYFLNICWLRLLDASFLRSVCLFPIIVTFRLHLELKVCDFDNYYHFLYDALNQGLTIKNDQGDTLIIFGTVYWTTACYNDFNFIIYRLIILYTALYFLNFTKIMRSNIPTNLPLILWKMIDCRVFVSNLSSVRNMMCKHFILYMI